MCHGFRLIMLHDYFWVSFEHFWSECLFWGSWGSIGIGNWPKSITKTTITKFSMSKSVKAQFESCYSKDISCFRDVLWLYCDDEAYKWRHKQRDVTNNVTSQKGREISPLLRRWSGWKRFVQSQPDFRSCRKFATWSEKNLTFANSTEAVSWIRFDRFHNCWKK